MRARGFLLSILPAVAIVLALSGRATAVAADESSDDSVGTIATLLGDKDKDIRALGLQQVREAAKGTKATEQFAGLLAKLPADARVGLLDALADRGDKAARLAVLEQLRSQDGAVRDAALRALGSIGEPADMPQLVQFLSTGSEADQAAARGSLTHLPGHTIDTAIAGELAGATPKIRSEIIEILAARRAIGTVSNLLTAAEDSDPMVRKAAMAALGELATPCAKDVGSMLRGVVKAEPGTERDAAEKAVLLVCNRIEDPAKRAAPILVGWTQLFTEDQRTILLPALGRVGGPDALKVVEAAIADPNPRRADAGIRAICNWPDATVAPRLLALFQSNADPERQSLLLRALTRVAVLHDKRSNAQRLALLKTCMSLATHDDERNYVVKRAAAVRTVDALRFLVPFLERPPLAQEACASIVELAHHRELRLPNEAEFAKALDAVIRICKDPGVVDHAQRYKANKT
ncbi:MAG TPA: HEAT repeat domain-containing protein [Pirellulales bacterium]|nr:HEAT repeat domain-containing protein [Pirellulales bacterium]